VLRWWARWLPTPENAPASAGAAVEEAELAQA
jgi:hypothetical protein